jgi:hypothetical protein
MNMGAVILVSLVLGFLWNAVAVYLMDGQANDVIMSGFTIAGGVAGVVAGLFTVWSRKRTFGEERLALVLANYAVGIFAYWASFVIFERIRLCWKAGGWTDFDLADQLTMIAWLFIGGVIYSFILVPLCYVSRHVVWAIYGFTQQNQE